MIQRNRLLGENIYILRFYLVGHSGNHHGSMALEQATLLVPIHSVRPWLGAKFRSRGFPVYTLYVVLSSYLKEEKGGKVSAP